MKNVTIYTDGACSGNPGPGGWGCVLIYKDVPKKMSGYSEKTTNNQMELFAVIEALKALKEPCFVDLYSDSAYVCNAFLQKWIDNWQQNGFRTANKKPVQNVELWKELITLCKVHQVTFHKVKGHADNALNNECDRLATTEIANHIKND